MKRSTIRIRGRTHRGIDPRTGGAGVGPPTPGSERERSDSSQKEAPVESSGSPTAEIGDDLLEREAAKRRRVVGVLAAIGLLACGVGVYGFAKARSAPPPQRDEAPETQTVVIEPSSPGPEVSSQRSYTSEDHEKFAALAAGGESSRASGARPGTEGEPPSNAEPANGVSPERNSGSSTPEFAGLVDAGAKRGTESAGRAMDRAVSEARQRSEMDANESPESGRAAPARAGEAADRATSSGRSSGGTAGSPARRATGEAGEAEVERRAAGDGRPTRLSDRQIRDGMRSIAESVAVCRRQHRRRGVPLGIAKMYVSLRVEPTGRVSRFEVRPDSLSGTVLEDCLTSHSPRWRFAGFDGVAMEISDQSFILE